ncbi:CCR4-NOT transcription complex subunit 10 [Sergentomyia squamirostris]
MTDCESSSNALAFKEEDRVLLKESFDEFIRENYENSLKILNKLEDSMGWQHKISHNKAVVDYYRSDLQNHDVFRKKIQQLTGHTEFPDGFEIKEVKMCVAFYNQALLLYFFREPQQALKIMTAVLSVLNHANHLDEIFIQKAYLLTLNILLEINQPRKAEALLQQLRTRLGISMQALLGNEDKHTEDTEDMKLALPSKKDKSDDFREIFKLCTIRVNLANKNHASQQLTNNEDSAEFCIARGHQYYLDNDFQMAAKEMSKKNSNEKYRVTSDGEDQDTVVANNMGLIHFSVRHYAMAVRFFQHALNFDKNANIEIDQKFSKGSPLYAIGSSKQIDILYNLGVSLLHLQRPKEAFECLIVPLNYHHNNPRLWLRIAEACIMLHQQDALRNEKKTLVNAVIGAGTHRKYLLQPRPIKQISDSCLFAIPTPNLEFAVLCLRNAYTVNEFLVIEKELNEENTNVEWNMKLEGVASHPSNPLGNVAFQQLRSSILAAFSYVLLSLGDYTLSLKYGEELLKINNLQGTHKMLGHLYCAESLIMLNKVPEAISYLDPKFLSEICANEFKSHAAPEWKVNSLEAVQSIISYNLAVALAMKGDALELAKGVLMSCNHPIVANHVKMLKLYIELQLGNIDSCRKMIQIDTPQYT